jgi:hypothetical protein
MREIGIGIADALQHRHLPVLPQRLERSERRMQARRVGEHDQLILRDRDLRTQAVVRRIGIRHEGVEPVVAALQLDQHEQLAIVARGWRGPCQARAAIDRDGARGAEQRAGALEESASVHHRLLERLLT